MCVYAYMYSTWQDYSRVFEILLWKPSFFWLKLVCRSALGSALLRSEKKHGLNLQSCHSPLAQFALAKSNRLNLQSCHSPLRGLPSPDGLCRGEPTAFFANDACAPRRIDGVSLQAMENVLGHDKEAIRAKGRSSSRAFRYKRHRCARCMHLRCRSLMNAVDSPRSRSFKR